MAEKKKSTAKKKPAGKKRGPKPIKVDETMIKKAESLAAQGLTQEEIALCLDMAISTYYDKKDKYPELSKAITRGKAKGVAVVTNKLFELCKTGNVRAIEFFLERRGGWRREDIKHENVTVTID